MVGFSVTISSLYFGSSLEANVPIHTVLMHAFSDRGTVVLSSTNFLTIKGDHLCISTKLDVDFFQM